MAKPLVVIDQGYLKHLPGESHPERPERIQALLNLAGALDKQMFELASPRAATRADVEYTHGADHVRLVESTSKLNRYALDGDTITCRDSFGVALLAVGGFLTLLRSEEHTSELSHLGISYAVFCLKKKKKSVEDRYKDKGQACYLSGERTNSTNEEAQFILQR